MLRGTAWARASAVAPNFELPADTCRAARPCDAAIRVVAHAEERFRPAVIASVIGVFPERPAGKYFEAFPAGAVYAIEFEDGEAIDIPESLLEAEAVSHAKDHVDG